MRSYRHFSVALVGALVALGTLAACSAILGIHDPEIDRVPLLPGVDGGLPGADGGFVLAPDDGGPILVPDAGLQCPAMRADCNKIVGDGCEVDLTTVENCGSCGHKCLACTAGKCTPQLVASGGAIDYAGFVAVDDTNLYWASVGSAALMMVAKSGGKVTPRLGIAPFDATGIYVGPKYAGATVYSSAEGVRMIDPTTGAQVFGIQNDACSAALGFVADELGDVYYAHGSENGMCATAPMHITKRSANGGGGYFQPWDFTLGAYRAGESEWMAIDANNVYFVGYRDTAPGIYRISRTGGNASIVVGGQYDGVPLAVDDTSIYTIQNNDLGVAGQPAALLAIDKLTGVRTLLATGETSLVLVDAVRASLVIDATHVYWTADDGAGTGGTRLGRIMRVPKTGGAKETLADKQPGAYGVAVDSTSIYWTSTTSIQRIPK